MTTAIEGTQEIVQKTDSAIEEAEGYQIESPVVYEAAGMFLKGLKAIQKEINETFDPVVKSTNAAHKEAVAAKKKHAEPLKKAESIVKVKMGTYVQAEERKRRDEERRLQVEARKQEEERRLKEAEMAEAEGDEDAVEEALEEPVVAPPVVLASSTPKVQGVSYTKVWKYKIVKPDEVPDEYKLIDEKKIGQVVRAMKDQTKIPGVQAYSEQSVRSRS
ncbi:hypothetical protein LCGC14_1518630 [marine sediment metagenome]|uniref:Uncharacterized protein n=1 Tax=marine sediment metagenome TaxID=412755 RepID=A0A0F9M0D9_9ZZZZ